VSCELTRTVLHGYLDGELDAARAAEFEHHLESCAACLAAFEAQESLRSSLHRARLYESAPASLRGKIDAALAADSPKPSRWFVFPQVWLAAAAVLLIAFLGWPYASTLRAPGGEAVFAAEVVDAHLRSLQPGHLTDVVSTDQHTVKPWFDGKLAFVPPVKDYADEGFPLIGARLDVLGGQNVAALVYTRRKHIINVFVMPTKEPDSGIHAPGLRQGYQWRHWRRQGMEYCAVSDASDSDIYELAQLIYQ
jgi:mycothiol system anti-sigma-R factor